MPISVTAVDTTDVRKNVQDDATARRSPCRRPTRAIDGSASSSIATTRVTRSRALAITSPPAAADPSSRWNSPAGMAFSAFMTIDATTTSAVPTTTISEKPKAMSSMLPVRSSSRPPASTPISVGTPEPTQVRLGAKASTIRPRTAPVKTMVAGPAATQSKGMFIPSPPRRAGR